MKQLAIILLTYYEKLIDFVFLGLTPEEQNVTSDEFSSMKAKLAATVKSLEKSS